MGEILEKKGDVTGAMRVYEMALSQTGSNSVTPVVHRLIQALLAAEVSLGRKD